MLKPLSALGLAVASIASTAHSLASFPVAGGPSYQVGIPSSSSISSSAAGGIYLQLTAPASYQWVGLGIGEQMSGATIFVMYADGNGNVTISARDGVGHVEPQHDSDLQGGVTLLSGSGIVGDKMIANVHCTTCRLLSAKDDSASPFIAAWMEGSSLDTTSETATIQQHAPDSYRQFTFDLTAAALSSDSNPFVASSGTPTGSGSSPSSTNAAGGSNGGNVGSGSSSVVGTSSDELKKYRMAHGIIMSVVVVLLFPLGAIFMRMGGNIWGHAAIQLFSLCGLIAGFGLGVDLAKKIGYLFESNGTTHTIFGTVIFALFLLQPLGGIVHHLQYRKTGSRNPVSHLHIWLGRIILILGVINGGLGLKLAQNTKGGEIAYGVVAGVMAVVYLVSVILKRKGNSSATVDGVRSKRTWGKRSKEGMRDGSS